jgi:YHS domain-containing protein
MFSFFQKVLVIITISITFPYYIFSQEGEIHKGRQYFFSSEEIESGFAFEQFEYLIRNNRYCIYQKAVSKLLNLDIPDEYFMASIDYQDYFTTFSLAVHRTILQFIFSNVGGNRIGG